MNIKNIKNYFGLIALCCAVPAFIPQVYKVYQTNNTHSFSSRTLLLFWTSQIFWFMNAIFKTHDMNLALAASVNFTCFTYIIIKKHYNEGLMPHTGQD
jgi:uncharacterized protein with PQ loop repeat